MSSLLSSHPSLLGSFPDLSHISESLVQYFAVPHDATLPQSTIKFWVASHKLQCAVNSSLSTPVTTLSKSFRTGDGCESLIVIEALSASIDSLVLVDFQQLKIKNRAYENLRRIVGSKVSNRSATDSLSSLLNWGEWGLSKGVDVARKLSSVAVKTVKSIGSLVDLADYDEVGCVE